MQLHGGEYAIVIVKNEIIITIYCIVVTSMLFKSPSCNISCESSSSTH